MASAHVYTWTRADGRKRKAYRAKWIGADGLPKSKRGFDRKGDAQAYAESREVEARHGVTLTEEPLSGKTTVAAWSKTWLAGLEVRPSSAESYGNAVKRINADLGGRALTSLRPSEVKSWRRALQAKYAATTSELTASVLAMMLRAAVLDGLITSSPMPPSRGGSAGRVVDPAEILTLEQVRAWGIGMSPKVSDSKRHPTSPPVAVEMPVVAAQTGLRLGELLGLRPEDVDFLGRQIRVDHQLLVNGQYGPPKTAAATRTIPLPDIALEAMARHLERFPAVEGEPIFRTVRGYRWRRSTFWHLWQTGRDAAELPEWVHWHALRDVYASSLIWLGQDLRVVMTLMGHTSPDETLRTYARLWPDAVDGARTALNTLWSSESEGQSRARGGDGKA